MNSGRPTDQDEPTGTNDGEDYETKPLEFFGSISVGLLHSYFIAVSTSDPTRFVVDLILDVCGSGALGELGHGACQIDRVDRLCQVPVVAGGQGAFAILRPHVGCQRQGGDPPALFQR